MTSAQENQRKENSFIPLVLRFSCDDVAEASHDLPCPFVFHDIAEGHDRRCPWHPRNRRRLRSTDYGSRGMTSAQKNQRKENSCIPLVLRFSCDDVAEASHDLPCPFVRSFVRGTLHPLLAS
jgi:hypothetical protein